MQTKKIIILTTAVFFLSFAAVLSAQAQSTSTDIAGTPIDATPLSEQFNDLKNTSYGVKAGDYLTKIADWLDMRKEAVKQGIAQEKQEFKEILQKGISQIISETWNKIKNYFISLIRK